MKEWLKSVLEKLCGKVKSILETVLERVLDRAREIYEDKQLGALALEAVMNAAKHGFKGDEAWSFAREEFLLELRDAGRELSDCAVDTTLQLVYSAWKNEAAQ